MDADREGGPDKFAKSSRAEAQGDTSAFQRGIKDRMGHGVEGMPHITLSHMDGEVPLLALFQKEFDKIKNLSALTARLEAEEVADRRVRVGTEHIYKTGPKPLSQGSDK